ncbi:type 4a pilus biogenesis protein PilO [Patescibacteria group bacterium]
MKIILPLFFLIASGGLFWGVVDPSYAEVQKLQKDEKLFDDALDNSKMLQQMRDDLLAQYNSFPTADLERLEKILPGHVDNVRLVRDIDGIAMRYGMSLRGVSVEMTEETSADINVGDEKYGSVILTFSVTGPYKTFLRFLTDLEKSLRIVDVVRVAFSSSEKDLYEYNVSIKTYWLK